MSVEIKKIVVDGKALQLKVIKQLGGLSVENVDIHNTVCLGYYNIGKIKTYLFQNGNKLYTYIDYGWTISQGFKHNLTANGNRFKPFSNDEDRDIYFAKINQISETLIETQLFY